MSAFLLFFVFLLFHPFHVSVCEITYNASEQRLQLSHRVFMNDLEDALNARFSESVDILGKKETKKVDSLLKQYLTENFFMFQGEKEVFYQYLGYELEEDAVWFYLESSQFNDTGVLGIMNTMLFEMFPDQTNLVHFTYKEKIKSLSLNNETKKSILTYD